MAEDNTKQNINQYEDNYDWQPRKNYPIAIVTITMILIFFVLIVLGITWTFSYIDKNVNNTKNVIIHEESIQTE